LFVALGFFFYLLASSKRRKSAANTLLGFGLLFLGMEIMSQAMNPLRTYEPFLNAIRIVEAPELGILIGLLFTMIIQSSGATSGIVIAMAISGTITLNQAIPINLGASIGTCITAILGSLTLNREAKRTAYIHVVFQTIGVLIAYIMLHIPIGDISLYIYLTRKITFWITGTLENIPRQIAMAHTLMPAINHIIVFPLLPWIVKAFNKIYPPLPPKEVFGIQYLNEAILSEPTVALLEVKKEILRMVPIIEEMLQTSLRLFKLRDDSLCSKIKASDKQVDYLRREIVIYLTKVSKQQLTEQESRTQVGYLFIVNELENFADVIDKNVQDRAKKLLKKGVQFSEEGMAEVEELFNLIKSRFLKAMEAFDQEDAEAALSLLKEAEASWNTQIQLRRKHFQRLNVGVQLSLDTTEIHMDLLNHLYRLDQHIYHILQAFLEMQSEERVMIN
ncbi:MAG: Na/Pi symporter, partial [Spirochaetales bacterium]